MWLKKTLRLRSGPVEFLLRSVFGELDFFGIHKFQPHSRLSVAFNIPMPPPLFPLPSLGYEYVVVGRKAAF